MSSPRICFHAVERRAFDQDGRRGVGEDGLSIPPRDATEEKDGIALQHGRRGNAGRPDREPGVLDVERGIADRADRALGDRVDEHAPSDR
jgi:hypothetical protein